MFRAVLQGTPPGTVYALIALGFVLTYKTSGVFNLAFGAQAYVSAVAYFKTHTEWGWPIVPSFVVSVLLLAPLARPPARAARSSATSARRRRWPSSWSPIGLTLALPALFDLARQLRVGRRA